MVVLIARSQCSKGRYCLLIIYYEARQILWMKDITNSARYKLSKILTWPQSFGQIRKFSKLSQNCRREILLKRATTSDFQICGISFISKLKIQPQLNAKECWGEFWYPTFAHITFYIIKSYSPSWSGSFTGKLLL